MNVFIVRTKLQALIVNKILSTKEKKAYILVICYQKNKTEDAPEVYAAYNDLKENALCSIDVLSSDRIYVNVPKYLLIIILAFITRGKVFLAGIDNYPFAISYRLFPFPEINTFDDGSANFLKSSKYFIENPLNRKGFKGVVSAKLFPKGAAKYLRTKTKRHYTIFHKLDNIVEQERLINLDWNWSHLLDRRDIDKIPSNVNTVILGTVFEDHHNGNTLKERAHNLMHDADLYIMHPRERKWLDDNKFVQLYSPAESVLEYITSSQHCVLTVYHFNTTTSYSLKNNSNIKFIDLSYQESRTN